MRNGDCGDGDLGPGLQREQRGKQAADAEAGNGGHCAGEDGYRAEKGLEHPGGLMRRLEQLERVAVRVERLDLLAAGTGFDLVSKANARVL